MKAKFTLTKDGYENLVLCFHGPGLVGPIIGEYFAEYGKFKYCGGIIDEEGYPVTIIINGEAYPPIRVYESERNVLIIIDKDLKAKEIRELFEMIKSICKERNIKRIVMINGIEDPERRIFFISNGKKYSGIIELTDGVVLGLPAMILLQKEIESVLLLGGVQNVSMDPQSALKLIGFLREFLGEEIDLAPLEKEIEEFVKALEKIEIPERKKIEFVRRFYG